MTQKVYKILNESTGLYRTGGTYDLFGGFTKKGKLWSTLGHLKNHFRQNVTNRAQNIRLSFDPAKNIEYLVDGKPVITLPLPEAERAARKMVAIPPDQVVVEYELVEVRRFPIKDLLE